MCCRTSSLASMNRQPLIIEIDEEQVQPTAVTPHAGPCPSTSSRRALSHHSRHAPPAWPELNTSTNSALQSNRSTMLYRKR